jgi:hypothetical protein
VACSISAEHPEAGYATPLAMVMCLAMTLTVGALTARSATDLKLARRDLDRVQAEYVLAGEQVTAAMVIAQARSGPRLQWAKTGDLGLSEIVAEAEAAKIGFGSAAELDASVLQRLEVRRPGELRNRFRALAATPRSATVASLDSAGLWRLCGPTLVSLYGAAAALTTSKAEGPGAVADGGSKLGQLWRLRVSAGGWVDERIVRFTGDAQGPAATVERRFFRGEKIGSRCDSTFDAISHAG